jgi:hypothetical protein
MKSAGRHAYRVGGMIKHFQVETEDFIAEEIEFMFKKIKERVAFQ